MLEQREGPRTATPTEDLIPEARERQRRRHLRSGLLAGLCALLVAALVTAGVILFGGLSAGEKSSVAGPAANSTAKAPGIVYFRPVLCFAPPYDATGAVPSTAGPSCAAASRLTPQNLIVKPDAAPQGYATNLSNVPLDASLANVASTKPVADKPTSTVLLPGLSAMGKASDAQRYVLGPAEMSTHAIASASAQRNQTGQWVVDYTTTSAGAALWDKVAHETFHQLIAVELNGVVYSAPIIQPTQTSFSSFGGRGQISGALTRADAHRLAAAMGGHR